MGSGNLTFNAFCIEKFDLPTLCGGREGFTISFRVFYVEIMEEGGSGGSISYHMCTCISIR